MFGNRGQKAMACNGLNDDIVKYDTKELDECLSRFFAEIRESDGSDSEPDSLRVMLAQTKWQQNVHSEGTENSSSADRSQREKQELFAKKATENDQMQQKHLPFKMKSSYGKIVYLANKIQSLLYALWYLLTLHFGLRGCQEDHEMFVEDFSLNRDDQGTE